MPPPSRPWFAARIAIFALALTFVFALPADSRALRIVSLIPSLTEDLFAIGAGPNVVGVSTYTDYPAAAAKLPIVASFASIDAERIVALHPDLVLGIPAQGRLTRDLQRAGLRVELVSELGYDDIFTALARVGALTHREANARALIASLRRRAAALVRTVPAGPRPATFVVVELAPLYTIGDSSYVARLVALAGGRNAAHDVRLPYAPYSDEALVAAQPDVIVSGATSGLAASLSSAPWRDLRAVRSHRVYILANSAILVRPGPRYVEGLAWLIAHLHGRPGDGV